MVKKVFGAYFFKDIKNANGEKIGSNMLYFIKMRYICAIGDLKLTNSGSRKAYE